MNKPSINNTVRTTLYLDDRWHEWLKEMSRIRKVPMQIIICEGLLLWSEHNKAEQETKLAKLEREAAEFASKLDRLEELHQSNMARGKALVGQPEVDADAAQRAKLKGLTVPNSAEAA